ncbi:MAG TPA: choice-of-anchor tandem repeat GloVer-containing protein [Rhizomicrobium sp.]|jgi:uncharacterized repeat protein (TIGR03803 family)|nr:choice-of-anchor tandem repeat GloVer-containing protein [Rhizomicrobium sp.]
MPVRFKRIIPTFLGTISLAGIMIGSAYARPGVAAPKKKNFSVLHNFAGGMGSGAVPFSGLVQDGAGNFYGTTVEGGALGAGTVFRLTAKGKETVLYSFGDGSDGGIPYANPVLDGQGSLYGTASSGGDHSCNCGVVFKVDDSGQEVLLHTFTGGSDGATPYGGLAFDKRGNLYGTTNLGGAGCNCGTVFELSPDGTEKILHAFAGGNDGAYPYYDSGVLPDKRGSLYGVTYEGGGSCNCGTIYKIDSGGHETVLYAFAGGGDGAYPQSTLIADKSGNLYGTTKYGGASDAGSVFELATDNTETTLYSFSGGDGANPQAGLVIDKNNNLYGTTQAGGTANAGTVFKITPAGGELVLHAFTGGTDGDQPFAPLFPGRKNELYGTATGGGKNGFGTVFQVKSKS